MDHFGIGAAMKAMAGVYFMAGRRSGRTTSLLESLKSGDRVIFSERRQAQIFERLCKERGIEVECVTVPLDRANILEELGSSPEDGRTIFDHTWVEGFYKDAIDRAADTIDHFQRRLSGYGEAHRATRRQAEELARWNGVGGF